MKNFDFIPSDSKAIFESYIKDRQRQINEMRDGAYETLKTMYDEDDNEVEVNINYNYTKGYKGARGDYGVPMEPDEAAQVHITSVLNSETGEEIELNNYDRRHLEDEILRDVQDADWQGGYDD